MNKEILEQMSAEDRKAYVKSRLSEEIEIGGHTFTASFNIRKIGHFEEYKKEQSKDNTFNSRDFIANTLLPSLQSGSFSYSDLADLILYAIAEYQKEHKIDKPKIYDWLEDPVLDVADIFEKLTIIYTRCVQRDYELGVADDEEEVEEGNEGKPQPKKKTKKATSKMEE